MNIGGVQGHVIKIVLGQRLPRGLESVPAAVSGNTCVQQLRNAACSSGRGVCDVPLAETDSCCHLETHAADST